jgi:hypothetical protein
MSILVYMRDLIVCLRPSMNSVPGGPSYVCVCVSELCCVNSTIFSWQGARGCGMWLPAGPPPRWERWSPSHVHITSVTSATSIKVNIYLAQNTTLVLSYVSYAMFTELLGYWLSNITEAIQRYSSTNTLHRHTNFSKMMSLCFNHWYLSCFNKISPVWV